MRRILAVFIALLAFSLSACASRKSVKTKPEKTKIVAYSIGEDTLKADGVLMFRDTEGDKFIIKVDDEKDGQTVIISNENEIKVLDGKKTKILIKDGEIILNDTLKINEIIKEELNTP